jgi:hypothetical protein
MVPMVMPRRNDAGPTRWPAARVPIVAPVLVDSLQKVLVRTFVSDLLLLSKTLRTQETTVKKLVYLAIPALLGVSLASPSFAGERGGNGALTPIGLGITAAAICAFSGLDDQEVPPPGGVWGPIVPGDTQTPHEEGGNILAAGVARICSILNHGKTK